MLTSSSLTGENALRPLTYFYYLAPVWFLAEFFFWPGFRAGIIFGNGALGLGAFYCAEGLIGVALWKRRRWAAPAALAENTAYLVLAFKYILFAPLDAAAAIAADTGTTAAFASHYANSLPGIIYSVLHVVLRIKSHVSSLTKD